MNLTLKASLVSRNQILTPWTGFYFLQFLLIDFALGYDDFSLFYAAATTCILLLLWRIAPRLQKIIIGFFALISACYYPFSQTYGEPNFNTLLALHSTNLEESTEVLTIFPWYNYVIGLFIFALGVIALRRKIIPTRRKTPWARTDSLCLLVTVVGIFYTPVYNHFAGWGFKMVDMGYPTYRFVKDVIVNYQQVVDEKAQMLKLANMKDSWHVTAVKPAYHTYVVVIGESARRDALGAFGGDWDNTPWASSVNGTLFTDYIAASGSTQKSLGLTFNQVVDNKPQYQNNFMTLANRAGFQTWWFSNQGQIGQYDTDIASIAKRADEVHFLKNGDFQAAKSTNDNELLAMTEQVLSVKRSEPQLIVLHLMGSHPAACERTHDQYATFVQSKETSCYLFSMTQTDELLSKLHKQLQDAGESFSMVYFSDHGLALKHRDSDDQFFVHDDQFQSDFQVPFMVVSSDDKTHKIIKARRSANDFLGFFSQWTGIKAEEISLKYPFMSEKKAPDVYITDFSLQKVSFDKLAPDPFKAKTK